MDYEAADRAALFEALLCLLICPKPRCGRTDLRPVALFEDVWGCESCRETWYLPMNDSGVREVGK